MVTTSPVDMVNALFLVFLPVNNSLFCSAGSKTMQKSSIEQKILVILSVEIISRTYFNILNINTLIY